MATITIDTTNLDPAVTAALNVILAATGQPKAEMPADLKAAKQHCYAARIARAEADPRKGLTREHRHTIAAELGREYTSRQWLAACKAFKAAGRHL